MPDQSANWELLSRKTGARTHGLLGLVRHLASPRPQAGPSTIWTVRHRATGLVRRLTARTELEARVKIANGLFDAS